MDESAPQCPTHRHPLTLLEQGVLNGVTYRYWGHCPGDPQFRPVVCDFHAAHPLEHVDSPRECGCRAELVAVCGYEVRTDDVPTSPTLF